jgi:hypothetical protein
MHETRLKLGRYVPIGPPKLPCMRPRERGLKYGRLAPIWPPQNSRHRISYAGDFLRDAGKRQTATGFLRSLHEISIINLGIGLCLMCALISRILPQMEMVFRKVL